MATTNHGAIVTPDGSGVVNPVTALAAMSASIEPGVIGYYADETARDAGTLAMRNAGKKGMRAFVAAPNAANAVGPDWCGWTGTEWIYDHPTPIEYNFVTGASPAFTLEALGAGGSYANYSSATYSFTPSRTGWAEIYYEYDAASLNTTYAAASVRVRFLPGGGGAVQALGDRVIGFSSDTRYKNESVRIPAKVRFVKSQAAQLLLDVGSFSATGTPQWQFNSFGWHAVQQ
jgi:hypothetical protein